MSQRLMKLFFNIFLLLLVVAASSLNANLEEGEEEQEEEASAFPAPPPPPKHKTTKPNPDISTSGEHYGEHEEHNVDYDHEAITGSHKEAEEFKEMAPEEAKKRLAVIVNKMDVNNDKCVDNDELTNWIIQSFKNLDVENARYRYNDLDQNKDGKITWAEYLDRIYHYSEKDVDEFRKGTSDDAKDFIILIDDDRLSFDLADTNKDGVLDIDEHVAFAHPSHYPHMKEYEIRKTFHDFDKNNDSFINLAEFLGEDEITDNTTREFERKQFAEFDKNKDGKIDNDEIMAWVMPGFRVTAQSETDHLFGEADENKDGKLCKDEILKHHDLFVGSQATDFGKHLDDIPRDEL